MTHYSAPWGSSSNGTKMSSKKSVRTKKNVNFCHKGYNVTLQGGLQLMPAGVELLILPYMTSLLNGRKTTIRNSTADSVSCILLETNTEARTIDIDKTICITDQALRGPKKVVEADT
jgi:hypothetical protein